MNITFLTVIMFFVTVLALRSYLIDHSLTIILLGSGSLALGLGGLIAGFSILGNNINSTVTIYNTSACIAGFFILSSAFLSIKGKYKKFDKNWFTIILYSLIVVAIILISRLILNNAWPPYFIPGSGPTIYDITDLYITIFLFGLSAVILLINSDNEELNFRRWYGLGLGLIAIGLFGVSIQANVGDTLNWIGRISQYMGATYILIAIISSIRDTGYWLLPWENAIETEIKYRIIVETANEGIMIADPDGSITFANPKITEMLGYTNDELIGINGSKLVREADKKESAEKIKKRKKGLKEDYEFKLICKDGSDLWVHVSGNPIYNRKGKHIGNLGMYTDISSRKTAEEELITTLKELKRSNHELEQFAYVASHDLQEPLRMVSLYSQLLERRYKDHLDDDGDEFIEFIVEGSHRMKNLIDDLLEYSRVTKNAKEFEDCNMEEVLNNALSNLSVTIEETHAEISYDPLPTVFADKSQMTQVLQNIIGNSIKFHGEENPKIHVSAIKLDDEWIFNIIDNGIGIDSKYQMKIFEVFKRLHTRDKYPGSGIGLSICLKIIRRHSGNIWVESNLDKGSTFYFTLPLKN